MGNAAKKSIIGASHVPNIKKGMYQVGSSLTRLDYNKGPTTWRTNPSITFGGALARMAMKKEFFGGSMCGDCISTKVTGGHDRNVHERRVCQLCGTLWPGLEPHNDRRGAIMAQRARKTGFKANTPARDRDEALYPCSSCQDVGCVLCL